MKIKTQDLTGPALDWAVAKAEGLLKEQRNKGIDFIAPDFHGCHWVRSGAWFRPSTDWAQGGPIIDREDINLMHAEPGSMNDQAGIQCTAHKNGLYSDGITPLIAAMRCYCSAKLGDEIDIPEELCQQQNN